MIKRASFVGKNSRYLILLIIGGSLFSILAFDIQKEDWSLKKDKDGIKVYTRKIEGSPLKEYRATMYVNRPLSEVKELILDVSKYPLWQHNCADTEFIKKEDEKTTISYIHTSAPWPVSDRDLVVKITEEAADIDNFRIGFNAIEGHIPENKSWVRIKYMKGYWQVDKVKNGRTQIIHQVHADPAGKLPDWLLNAAVVETPFKTMENLKKMLR